VLTAIAEHGLLAFAGTLLVAQLAAFLVGYRLALRRRRRGEKEADSVGVVVGGILGLLGFVLALTLSFANTRFEERRQGSLQEANAIGTAWLRAEAVGGPRGAALAELIEEYTRIRLEYVRAEFDPKLIGDMLVRTEALQGQMWGHAIAVAREVPTPITALLLSALNDMIDASTAERFAFAMRMPDQLVWLLLAMTLLGMAAVGFQIGLRHRAVWGLVIVLTITWNVVIVSILDLAAPRFGSMRTSSAAYEWTLRSFESGVAIPPLPAPR
jgi:hypothetical protein